METNFETQAAAATDLGGIEISRNRLVITIGLGTITYNQDAPAIIIAAGEAKAPIIKDSLESQQDVKYPASVLRSETRFDRESITAKDNSASPPPTRIMLFPFSKIAVLNRCSLLK